MQTLHNLITDEAGSSAMDYALIASLVSVGAIAGFLAFAGSATRVWEIASQAIVSALN